MKKSNPSDVDVVRRYNKACFSRSSAINVSGIFEADDFSVARTHAALQFALRSRNPERRGSKAPGKDGEESMNMNSSYSLQPGQRGVCHFLQDMRFEEGGGCPTPKPFFFRILEIVNVKPDEEQMALCVGCGTPNRLQKCSGCQTARYCSRECQKSDWKKHKKECKHDKVLYDAYRQELEKETKPPKDFIAGDRIWLKKYDPSKLRFAKGTKVECKIGDNVYGTGRVVEVLHECDGWTHAYEIQLDWTTAKKMGVPYHLAQVWADWDCDFMIRKV